MSKPNKIFLIRHGESTGNVDRSIYEHTPDWKVELTDKGKTQARDVSEIIYNALEYTLQSFIRVHVYSSPWIRARQTAEPLIHQLKCLDPDIIQYKYYEDPRLREQDWGNFPKPGATLDLKKERNKYGPFFYRFPNGESGADVYDRISTFLETLHRDFEKNPTHVVVFTHGFTMRCFLMRWFHWSVEEFETIKNPINGHIYTMTLNHDTQKYTVSGVHKRKDF
jgi:broad specificity phosphatase PhoE